MMKFLLFFLMIAGWASKVYAQVAVADLSSGGNGVYGLVSLVQRNKDVFLAGTLAGLHPGMYSVRINRGAFLGNNCNRIGPVLISNNTEQPIGELGYVMANSRGIAKIRLTSRNIALTQQSMLEAGVIGLPLSIKKSLTFPFLDKMFHTESTTSRVLLQVTTEDNDSSAIWEDVIPVHEGRNPTNGRASSVTGREGWNPYDGRISRHDDGSSDGHEGSITMRKSGSSTNGHEGSNAGHDNGRDTNDHVGSMHEGGSSTNEHEGNIAGRDNGITINDHEGSITMFVGGSSTNKSENITMRKGVSSTNGFEDSIVVGHDNGSAILGSIMSESGHLIIRDENSITMREVGNPTDGRKSSIVGHNDGSPTNGHEVSITVREDDDPTDIHKGTVTKREVAIFTGVREDSINEDTSEDERVGLTNMNASTTPKDNDDEQDTKLTLACGIIMSLPQFSYLE